VRPGFAQYQNSERFRPVRARDFNDHAGLYFRLTTQLELNVFRVNVNAGRGNDDLSFSPFEIEVARFVELANVARAKPTVGYSRRPFVTPVSRRDILPLHQDFAVLGQFHLLTSEYFTDGAAPLLERVVNADKRRRLSHAIALNHRVSQALPELLGIRIERRAA
jgi:hypothetical protein